MNDFRFGIRSLSRSPGFSAVVIGILALGIGAATAVFSALDALLLQPLPGIAQPAGLVSLETVRKGDLFGSSYPDYRDYRDRNRSFSSLAARASSWVLVDDGREAHRVTAELITGSYFATLGIRASAGRFIDGAKEDSSNAPANAVISHSLWRSSYGSDPHVVGKVIRVNGQPFEIVGVTDRDFHGTLPYRTTDVFVPLGRVHQVIPHLSAGVLENRASLWLAMFGRLKEGVTLAQAQSEMDVLAQQIARANPVVNEGRVVRLVRGVGFDSEDRGTLRRFFVLLMSVVGLLLAIVCANVANLLLTRGIARRREIAVRVALGASRRRVVQQLFIEGGMLATAGALAALVVAPAIVTAFGALPRSLFGFESIPTAINAEVLGFAIVLTAVCTLSFSLVPALQAVTMDINGSMKNASLGEMRSRLPRVLVILQVGISLVLLIGAGLMMRSARNALTAPSGYISTRVLLANLDLGLQGYGEEQGLRVYGSIVTSLRQQPGVETVSIAQTAPSNPFVSKVSLFHPGEVPPPQERNGRLFDLGVRTDFDPVLPGYFDTLSITRLQGRDFSDADDLEAPRVCIVSKSLAQALWPNADAVGQPVDWPPDNGPVRHLRVVGVVSDVHHRSPFDPFSYMVYVPLRQEYDSRATVLIRYRSDPAEASQRLLAGAAAVDRSLAVFSIRTLEEQVRGTVWQQRIAARLIGIFAFAAVALTVIGLYGLLSYFVARRRRELGIRMALGAPRAQLLWLVIRQSFQLVFSGIALGLVLALGITRWLEKLLFEVSSADTLTFAAMALATSVVGLAASLIPARRAAKVDPAVSLRME